MERHEGYYWVYWRNDWVIAKYIPTLVTDKFTLQGHFFIGSDSADTATYLYEGKDDFQILEERIKPPKD